ncbi:hypothetical protein K457DRAFT_261548 [Linnemannia elongata AG-77]|uniref:Uncharacterized protein n=1 Tax=Linnemannia elongata AG-77 TaxID=1314771 RepID=A0A197JEU1_9FUNG|nr:hypothetical protein K457DRAFT_261548 [Linnemannia elongata AG-77]
MDHTTSTMPTITMTMKPRDHHLDTKTTTCLTTPPASLITVAQLCTRRTPRSIFEPLSKDIHKAVAKFPWTGRHENIRILTNSRCGSACGIDSYFLTTTHGVEAYSIGGARGRGPVNVLLRRRLRHHLEVYPSYLQRLEPAKPLGRPGI